MKPPGVHPKYEKLRRYKKERSVWAAILGEGTVALGAGKHVLVNSFFYSYLVERQ